MLLTLKRGRPEQDSNPDLCDASAVLYQLSYQGNWELVVMWVHCKSVDDGCISIDMMLRHESDAFELRVETKSEV